MKINILPIASSLHDQVFIEGSTKNLINKLKDNTNFEINITDINSFYNSDLSLILVQSGGSENVFLQMQSKLKPPFYLLTYGHNNSLAASIEILSYIKDLGLEGEILHGSTEYLKERIKNLIVEKDTIRLGVIGKPSDWLIASNVNYQEVKKYHNIELVDINIDKVINKFQSTTESKNLFNGFKFDLKELNKSENVYSALKQIKDEYNLDGLTIRCFDLLSTIKTTSCMALAKLNSEGIVSCCEGDIPTMISMEIVKRITNSPSFQANPSRIDIENKKMVFAHCTIPLDMVENYSLNTHYESKIGVAIKGELKENQEITIFKLSNNMKDYFLCKGKIIRNLNEENLCRTQIEVEIDNPTYFLNRPYGNHHLIIYGNHTEVIKKYMDEVNLK